MRRRLDRGYFEALYADSPDPWNFEGSEYERRKYQRTLNMIKGRRFRRAFEAGSSIGVFTRLLAPLCDELLAADISERAVTAAKERLSAFEHVRIEHRMLPEEMPEGPFDLIVASEILYYLTRGEMLLALQRFEKEMSPGSILLAVHWRMETRTYPLQGDEVHELIHEHTRLRHIETVVEPEYRMDMFEDRV